MGRHRYAVVVAVGISLCGAETTLSQPQHANGARQGHAVRPEAALGFERWRQMRPDERQRFRSNAERWLQMAPEEQRVLRDREAQRRERLQRAADAALRQSGLDLEAERREQYERRYMQERRRIEQELRRELEERRQRELAPVVERLKREFEQQKAVGSPTGRALVPAGK